MTQEAKKLKKNTSSRGVSRAGAEPGRRRPQLALAAGEPKSADAVVADVVSPPVANPGAPLLRFDLLTDEDLAGVADIVPPPRSGTPAAAIPPRPGMSPHRQGTEKALRQNAERPAGAAAAELATKAAVLPQLLADQRAELKHYQADNGVIKELSGPADLAQSLKRAGYDCSEPIAAQMALCLSTTTDRVRTLLLEGPAGSGKNTLVRALAAVLEAELLCLSCHESLDFGKLIAVPGGGDSSGAGTLPGTIARAFQLSQKQRVLLLIDDIDKAEADFDSFLLGPLQDGRIWPETAPPLPADLGNLLVVITKSFDRRLSDALLRCVQPLNLKFLDAANEARVLAKQCLPQLIANLSALAESMRGSDASYEFERPPAPEEILTAGRYVMRLLAWDIVDFSMVGRSILGLLAKSDADRFTLELMLRYHPDYYDPLRPNGRKLSQAEVAAKLGRLVLRGLVTDPEEEQRRAAGQRRPVGLGTVGTPPELISKLAEVGYECLPYLAAQICLLLNTPMDRVRSFLLEGPPGCGKSYMAKSLAKITGAELMCLSCYDGMNTQHLIEQPSTLGLASAMAGVKGGQKAKLVNLGILSRAFLKSQSQPVILLIDEIDKTAVGIDTFFLGPIQDGVIYLESRPPIAANIENLLLVFTKNYVRSLNDALLRRVHPITLSYLNAELEEKILSPHCDPQLIANLVGLVNRMRSSQGSYGFDRPPAPEEILIVGHYVNNLLRWGVTDFAAVGGSVWSSLCKSDRDRSVMDHMLRFHPDFLDPLKPDGRLLREEEVQAKLGRTILAGLVTDPEGGKREAAWKAMEYE